MRAVFVLVHSPAVGPLTWRPVARELRERGHEAIVPSLLDAVAAGPPYWPRVVDAVRQAVEGVNAPLVAVCHSGAGPYAPALASSLGGRLAATVFADALLPAESGSSPLATPRQLGFLRDLADDEGLLPPWTSWFDERHIAPMFPDPAQRRAVEAEQPRLPLAYFEARIPVPAAWHGHPCFYLRFSPAYAEAAEEARRRGWPVADLPGTHLHQLTAPGAVAARLLTVLPRVTPPAS
ncbi:alpha/beta hydrolase [Bailinhaonella thermotolerans]|uniref:Alpha/beta hydrolase n=1 Tax=Bailinhaonella thermotolerans TaxID=1070861 RepID=A0A3A4AWX3_9ACTN|nr:alpha/beta hydrolase [Bailinhaonella thermotolerans]RJL30333.1 alpha/beta hydrolase [Bailinhaonella thermotolerans]